MHNKTPFDHDEKLRRKWWRYLVVNGHVEPCVFESEILSPGRAATKKKRSSCGGMGYTFHYDWNTKVLSGYFRPSNPMTERGIADWIGFFKSKISFEEWKGDLKKSAKKQKHDFEKEINESRNLMAEIIRENIKLKKLYPETNSKKNQPKQRCAPCSLYRMITVGTEKCCIATELIAKTFLIAREQSKEILDEIYLDQAEILSKLIRRFDSKKPLAFHQQPPHLNPATRQTDWNPSTR